MESRWPDPSPASRIRRIDSEFHTNLERVPGSQTKPPAEAHHTESWRRQLPMGQINPFSVDNSASWEQIDSDYTKSSFYQEGGITYAPAMADIPNNRLTSTGPLDWVFYRGIRNGRQQSSSDTVSREIYRNPYVKGPTQNNGYTGIGGSTDHPALNAQRVAICPSKPFAAGLGVGLDAVPVTVHHPPRYPNSWDPFHHLQKAGCSDIASQRNLAQPAHSDAGSGYLGHDTYQRATLPFPGHQYGQPNLRPPPLKSFPRVVYTDVIPALYNSGLHDDTDAELTAEEVAHHYLPFHHLPSITSRMFSTSHLASLATAFSQRRRKQSAGHSRSISDATSSSHKTATLVAIDTSTPDTTLADLVRDSEPLSPVLISHPLCQMSAYGTKDHRYFCDDRDILWTCTLPATPNSACEANTSNDPDSSILPEPPREIVASYSIGRGWRSTPSRRLAATRYGAVGERLVPLVNEGEGEAKLDT